MLELNDYSGVIQDYFLTQSNNKMVLFPSFFQKEEYKSRTKDFSEFKIKSH